MALDLIRHGHLKKVTESELSFLFSKSKAWTREFEQFWNAAVQGGEKDLFKYGPVNC